MKLHLLSTAGFYAWYLIPTVRCGRHLRGGGFCYLMWLKWDIVGVTW